MRSHSKEPPSWGPKQPEGSLCSAFSTLPGNPTDDLLPLSVPILGDAGIRVSQAWDQRAEKLATCSTSQKGRYSSLGVGEGVEENKRSKYKSC